MQTNDVGCASAAYVDQSFLIWLWNKVHTQSARMLQYYLFGGTREFSQPSMGQCGGGGKKLVECRAGKLRARGVYPRIFPQMMVRTTAPTYKVLYLPMAQRCQRPSNKNPFPTPLFGSRSLVYNADAYKQHLAIYTDITSHHDSAERLPSL